MNGTIDSVISGLAHQWGLVQVIAQENVAMAEEIQAKMAEMSAHATRMMNLSLTCACVAFVLAVGAATLLLWRGINNGRHKRNTH